MKKHHGSKKKLPLMDNIQIKLSDGKFIPNEDLQKYHDIYTKLNKLKNNEELIYVINEEDLNNTTNNKIPLVITPKKSKPIPDKAKLHRSAPDISGRNQITIDKLEALLADLTNSDNFKTFKPSTIEPVQEIKEQTPKSDLTKHDAIVQASIPRNHYLTVSEKDIHPYEVPIDTLTQKNISYDINDEDFYDSFAISQKGTYEEYIGLPSKSISSMTLVNKSFIGKVINYTLIDGTNVVFLIYSTAWDPYKHPIYVIIHNHKFTIKRFITIFNNIINLVT